MFKVVYEGQGSYVDVMSDEEFEAERARLDNSEYLPRVHADDLTQTQAEAEAERMNALARKEYSR